MMKYRMSPNNLASIFSSIKFKLKHLPQLKLWMVVFEGDFESAVSFKMLQLLKQIQFKISPCY